MSPARTPELILTGGTICCRRNIEGKLFPDPGNLSLAIEDAGLNDIPQKKLFDARLDSIDFDIREHYPPLRDAALAALKSGHTPVIVGGTDTLTWYSSLLTRDLMRRGYLKEGSGESVIFLSSMKSYQEDPQHVVNILKAGNRLCQIGLSGGFALNAERDEADHFVVHDVTNRFDKISGELTNAFRSECPVGYLFKENFEPLLQYHRPAPSKAELSDVGSNIAPPLLHGYDSEAVLHYMKAMGEAQPPFDGIIIEGFPGKTGGKLQRRGNFELVMATEWLNRQGTRVIFCNPVRYNNSDGSLKMEPLIPDSSFVPSPRSLEGKLEAAGAEFVTATPRDAYLEAILDAPGAHHPPDHSLSIRHERPQAELGIRYVPDSAVMKKAINILAPKAKKVYLSALTHGDLPGSLKETLEKNGGIKKFSKGFEYDKNQYVDKSGGVQIEGEEPSPYQAGKATGALFAPDKGTQHKR